MQNETKLALEIIKTVYEAIKEAGPDGIIEGSLYAMLMSFGCSMHSFEMIKGTLIGAGLVTSKGHVLKAVS